MPLSPVAYRPALARNGHCQFDDGRIAVPGVTVTPARVDPEGFFTMALQPLEEVVRNVDVRLTRVEQILPTLATRTELADAIAPLATKAELAAAIAPLATKAELAEAIAPLATKTETREEGERTRRHFDAVAERLEGQIRLIAEGLLALQERMDSRFSELMTEIVRLDRRVMRLEVSRRT